MRVMMHDLSTDELLSLAERYPQARDDIMDYLARKRHFKCLLTSFRHRRQFVGLHSELCEEK